MKSVVILQSNYIPWKGYFDLIKDADVFIFMMIYSSLKMTGVTGIKLKQLKAVNG